MPFEGWGSCAGGGGGGGGGERKGASEGAVDQGEGSMSEWKARGFQGVAEGAELKEGRCCLGELNMGGCLLVAAISVVVLVS